MDGRFETRYPADLEAWVTDLQNMGHSACGVVRDISNSGICLSTPIPLGPADVVRLDIADSVLFGFVTYANPEPSQAEEPRWRTGIEVQRVLMGGSDLGQLLKKVLEEQMPQLHHEMRS